MADADDSCPWIWNAGQDDADGDGVGDACAPVAASDPPPAGGGCTAAYNLIAQWPGGFTASITVTNGAVASVGWTVTWTFVGGQTVTSLWNGEHTASGATSTMRNLSYNGALAPGQPTSFGFNATGIATNAVAGLTCTRW